jgi:hypothetical protein
MVPLAAAALGGFVATLAFLLLDKPSVLNLLINLFPGSKNMKKFQRMKSMNS